MLKDLRKDWRSKDTIFLVVTLLSIGLAIYFYEQSREARDPAYFVSSPIKIFDSQVASQITVVDVKGEPIDQDIYVHEVSLWNAGELPISPTDVRQSIGFTLPAESRILEFIVVDETHPGVANFGLTQVFSPTPGLSINWDHFDPGFGARFQIIYALPSEIMPELSVQGSVLGVERLRDGSEPVAARIFPVPFAAYVPLFLFGISLVSLIGILLFFLNKLYKVFNHWLPPKSPIDDTLRFLVLGFIFILLYWTSVGWLARMMDPLLTRPRPPI